MLLKRQCAMGFNNDVKNCAIQDLYYYHYATHVHCICAERNKT